MISYIWNCKTVDATAKNNIGVIAQEIKDVMPETVKKYNAKQK